MDEENKNNENSILNQTFIFLLRSNDKKLQKQLPQIFDLKAKHKNSVVVTHGYRLGPSFGLEDIYVDSTMSNAHTYVHGSFAIPYNNGSYPLSGNPLNTELDMFEL